MGLLDELSRGFKDGYSGKKKSRKSEKAVYVTRNGKKVRDLRPASLRGKPGGHVVGGNLLEKNFNTKSKRRTASDSDSGTEPTPKRTITVTGPNKALGIKDGHTVVIKPVGKTRKWKVSGSGKSTKSTTETSALIIETRNRKNLFT